MLLSGLNRLMRADRTMGRYLAAYLILEGRRQAS